MRSIVMLAGLLVATSAFAQTDAAQKDATQKEKDATQRDAADPAAARYAALEQKVSNAFKAWREEQREAAKKAREAADGGTIPAMSMVPPFAKFIPDFQAAAKEFAGQNEAVRFLLWITRFGSSDVGAVKRAAGTLVDKHISSEGLVELTKTLPRLAHPLGEAEVASMFDTIIEKSPHAKVRSWAVFGKVGPTLEDTDVAVDSEKYKIAKAQLRQASQSSEDDELAGRIKGLIASREQLADGQVAPDIIGIDLDGVKFKLSDYAGKIVMLDFWGDW